jgi:hypothetical protein
MTIVGTFTGDLGPSSKLEGWAWVDGKNNTVHNLPDFMAYLQGQTWGHAVMALEDKSMGQNAELNFIQNGQPTLEPKKGDVRIEFRIREIPVLEPSTLKVRIRMTDSEENRVADLESETVFE